MILISRQSHLEEAEMKPKVSVNMDMRKVNLNEGFGQVYMCKITKSPA